MVVGASGALSFACGSPSTDPLASVQSPIEGGDPINLENNPVSSLFPQSTVYIETIIGTTIHGCTGEILSTNKILTAAHCVITNGTTVHLYPITPGSGDEPLPGVAIPVLPGASGPVRDVPDGIDCTSNKVNDPTCLSTWGKAGPGTAPSHFADLAVITLASNISVPPYQPVWLAPRDSYSLSQVAPGGPRSSWEVGTGQMNPFIKRDCNATDPYVFNPNNEMQWVPLHELSPSDHETGLGTMLGFSTNQALGVISTTALFGDHGDSGGPLFQYTPPATGFGTRPSGPNTLMLVGVLSSGATCQAAAAGLLFSNWFTSVEYPDNYDWLTQEGASPIPDLAAFGASR
jgi:hypothetical protein